MFIKRERRSTPVVSTFQKTQCALGAQWLLRRIGA